jgi:hypothetical protein
VKRLFAGAALIVLGCAQLALAADSRADAPTKVGWWNEAQQAPAPAPTIPAPPTSPDGGMTVVNAPNGPAAIGAVYYPVGDITGATLTLSSATPIEIPQGDGLIGCLVQTPGWQAGGNQRWDTKPAIDPLCTPAKLDASGMKASFALSSAFRDADGAVDVAILPTGTVPFAVNFEKPDASSLQTVAAPAAASDPAATPAATDFVPGEVVDGTSLLPDDSQFAFAVPPPVAPSAPPAQALGGYPTGVAVPKVIEHTAKERVAVVLILAGLLLSLWRLAGMMPRAPRLLGSLGAAAAEADVPAPAVAGIGRFARVRATQPRRLT